MSERRAVGLTVLVLLGLVVVPAAATGAAAPDSLGGVASAQPDFERTTFVIRTFENGSARWTFEYTRPLANDSQRQSFQTFASDFNENSTELYQNFRTRAQRLTSDGTNITGREMTATGFSRRAYVAGPSGNQGVVRMSFTWTNFAVVEDETVVVGDVFEGGLYLTQDQRLRIERGPNLEFHPGVDPPPDSMSGPSVAESDSLTWSGERQFNDNKPRVEMGPPGSADPGGDPDGPGGEGMGLPTMLALALVLVLGAGGAVAWWNGAFGSDTDDAAAVSADDDEPPSGPGAAAEGDSGGPTGEVAGEPAVPDEELLSDEDRVIHLLEDNGGRMKQVNIVEETGWSKSKVSMLLSDMEEADQISKLRVGRENVISLRGHEPDAARSPFDEEE